MLLSKNYLREEDKTIDIDIDVSCRPITGSGFEEFTDQQLLKSSPIYGMFNHKRRHDVRSLIFNHLDVSVSISNVYI